MATVIAIRRRHDHDADARRWTAVAGAADGGCADTLHHVKLRVMKIRLNGEEREVANALSVTELLAASGYAERRVAVEINREIVPKSRHDEHRVNDGDRIEIVHALGGG